MEATALLLLISGVGVGFGWQPMPDGSQRYEYTVQIEPELAATLAEGKPIPIVADIPPEVQPVGRIRVVVGREELPRQRLVTHLKPATDGAQPAGEGVKLAQFTQSPAQRYGPPPAAEQDAATTWNSQPDPTVTPTEAAPPSGQQLFGQPQTGGAVTWNNGAAVPAVADAASDALNRVGQEVQNAVAPVKEGLQQADTQLRGAVDNLRDRTKNLVDEIRQPFNPQPQLPANAQVPATTGSADARTWNPGASDAAAPNPLRSGGAAEDAGVSWNQDPPRASQSTQPPTTQPFATNPAGATPPAGGDASGTPWNYSQAPATTTTPMTGNVPPSQGQRLHSQDPWAGVPDPRTQLQGQQPANSPSVPELADRPMPFGGIGGNAPGVGPSFPTIGTGAGTAAPPQPGATAPSLATIGSEMLRQPGDRPLEDAPEHKPAGATNLAGSPVGPMGATPTTAVPPATTAPAPHTSANPTPQPATRDNAAAVLFAWVLLTGSVAGNMYLFWSYLDVRQKYRSLVRKTARAVGSRFSAA